MEHIDPERLETDLEYRFGYVTKFCGFGADDIAAIHNAAPLVAPLVPTVVNAVYDKLLSFDVTRQYFAQRHVGFEGPVGNLGELSHDDSQIQFRKDMLGRYLTKLVTAEYNADLVAYLYWVGQIHTTQGGAKSIDVAYVHCNALFAFVEDVLLGAIWSLNIPADVKTATLRAFSKLLWLQNDLFMIHYLRQTQTPPAVLPEQQLPEGVEHIDGQRLESDLEYRFGYVTKFCNFGQTDIDAIHNAAPLVAPLVPTVVNAVYDKLLSFDVTRSFFVERHEGFEGAVAGEVGELSHDDPQIQFRKDMLGRYLTKLVTAEYNVDFVTYLDWVGKIHTAQGGSKSIDVAYVHCNALFAFVEDVLLGAICSMDIPDEAKATTTRAFSKLLWLQNDLFARHYLAQAGSPVEHIDGPRLETDLEYRFGYVTKFCNFGEDDIAAIHGAAPLVAPLVPTVVNAVYDKLLGFDVTRQYFAQRHEGYEGQVAGAVGELSHDDPQIQFRKNMLGKYLEKLVTAEYNVELVTYLDWVGKIHTTKGGAKSIDVAYVHCNALFAFVEDVLLGAILGLDIPDDVKGTTMRAFSKLLWLQNDLFMRHYLTQEPAPIRSLPESTRLPRGVEHVDAMRLETDLEYRFGYVTKFCGFGQADIDAIHGAAPLVAPLVPTVVNAVYDKLLGFDVTREYFVQRHEGFDGAVAPGVNDLSHEDPQIQFRKDMLGRYLTKLVTAEYNVEFVTYLDWVGKIHTSKAGAKSIDVAYVHCNALFAFVEDVLLGAIWSLDIPADVKGTTLRAFSKLLWLQNDLFARHYLPEPVPEGVDHIDGPRLETDLEYRFGYITKFCGFGQADIDAIHGAAPLVAPLVPTVVNAVYDKLLGFDVTRQYFAKRHEGYEGEVAGGVGALSHDDPQIQFRKNMLGKYLEKLVTAEYNVEMVTYLDWVGKIHTSLGGSKSIDVAYVHCNALFAFVEDVLLGAICSLDIPADVKGTTMRAFSKLLWLQNDLFMRHYLAQGGPSQASIATPPPPPPSADAQLPAGVEHIEAEQLETDLVYRFDYVTKFCNFGQTDIAAIHASAPLVAPLVPTVVNAVYDKLLAFDVTRAYFVQRQDGFDGAVAGNLGALSHDDAQIQFRKNMLGRYLEKLVTAEYNAELVTYLDWVGKIHTTKGGAKSIDVTYTHVNALFAFVGDVLVGAILGLDLPVETKVTTVRAFAKLLWLQNDLFMRHYLTHEPAPLRPQPQAPQLPAGVEHIDAMRLETDLEYRFGYVTKFCNFGQEDIDAIHGAAPLVAPLVPTVVNAVYDKLLSFDVTRAYFVQRHEGFEGQVAGAVGELSHDDPQIQFRKNMLGKYLEKLVTAEYNVEMVAYLDWVGKIHTSKGGAKSIDVAYVHCNALFGFVEDVLVGAIWDLDIPFEAKATATRAFNKLLWLQNDLFARHYLPEPVPEGVEHVDGPRLETDLEYRFGYVTKFCGFGQTDIDAIHGAAPLVAPLVPTVVNAVYDKLLGFDVTRKYFVERHEGFDGQVAGGVGALSHEDPQIQFRKEMLGRYLTKLVTAEYNVDFVTYLDWVGKIHTSKAGSKSIDVAYVHCNALFAFVEDVLLGAIWGLDIPEEAKVTTLRAFSKLLWLQNDLFARHYLAQAAETAAAEESASTDRLITMEEVSRHNSPTDAWTVIHDVVYDMTEFVRSHPGGQSQIMRGAGCDGSALFDGTHPRVNPDDLVRRVGRLAESTQWITVTCKSREPAGRNSWLVKFEMPQVQGYSALGFMSGEHLNVRVNGHTRPYTPVSAPENQAEVHLLVKAYPGGAVSAALGAMEPGAVVEMSGPCGQLQYLGQGRLRERGVERNCAEMLLLAGGSGITPALQLARSALLDPEDPTRVTLLYGNQSEPDIMARPTLDHLAASFGDRFKLVYCHKGAFSGNGATFVSGRISKEVIETHGPRPAGNVFVAWCGPAGFNAAMGRAVRECGYTGGFEF